MSLKRRLVAGTLVLLVAGIVTTDLVTSSSLRSFLYGRVDEQIDAAQDTAYTYIDATYQRALAAGVRKASTDQQAWLAELSGTRTNGVSSLTPIRRPTATTSTVPAASRAPASSVPRRTRLDAEVLARGLSPDVYVEVIDGNGQVVFQRPSGSSARQDPAPSCPRRSPCSPACRRPSSVPTTGPIVPDRPAFDVPGSGRAVSYRVEAVALPGGTLITAVPLDPTNQTLASLIHVEVIVSIVVVLALLVLALWIVRFGLRPLEEMTQTAGAIAGGDLTQRIRRPRGARRGGTARLRPERHAQPDRSGLRRADVVGIAAAAVRGRRLPRVADAAHVDPGLRRAAAQGRARGRGGPPPRR